MSDAVFGQEMRLSVSPEQFSEGKRVVGKPVEKPQERRKYARLKLELPIHISGTDAEGRKLEESSVTLNVSARGAYFTSQTPFHAPMALDVSISVPYSVWGKLPFPRLEAPARVVRVEHPSYQAPGESEQWGVAVCFEEALTTTFETGENARRTNRG